MLRRNMFFVLQHAMKDLIFNALLTKAAEHEATYCIVRVSYRQLHDVMIVREQSVDTARFETQDVETDDNMRQSAAFQRLIGVAVV